MAKSSVHVKKDDQVIVISGKDKGAKGKVLMVDEKKGRVYVEGVNMVKKHQKAKTVLSPGSLRDPARSSIRFLRLRRGSNQ